MAKAGLLTVKELLETMFFKCGGIELRRPVQTTKLDLSMLFLAIAKYSTLLRFKRRSAICIDDTRPEEIAIKDRGTTYANITIVLNRIAEVF